MPQPPISHLIPAQQPARRVLTTLTPLTCSTAIEHHKAGYTLHIDNFRYHCIAEQSFEGVSICNTTLHE